MSTSSRQPNHLTSAPMQPQGLGDQEDRPGLREMLHPWLQSAAGWMTSGVFHMTLLIVAALLTLSVAVKNPEGTIVAAFVHPPPPPPPTPPVKWNPTEQPNEEPHDLPLPKVTVETMIGGPKLAINPLPNDVTRGEDIFKPVNLDGGGILGPGGPGRSPFGSRNPAHGPPAAASAVALALEWLARHQLADGSWSFDHRRGACQGRCGDPGSLEDARIGATALGVLPFLGYGQTHKQGKYRDVVRRALAYLGKQMERDGSLHEAGGTMYSHGLAAIALCEAYGMTRDTDLIRAAQKSLDFITQAQDPQGGGWRYAPQEPGDTSVVGWQLMALKSGHLSYLNVNPNTIKGASRFLDSVEEESGAYYGYRAPGRSSATTAIGLLCRMYLGWKHENPALERGVEFLAKSGPSDTNVYYNYYATQVLRHYGGPQWDAWNKQILASLTGRQQQQGHARGSWFLGRGGDHGAERGGRHYQTCMCAMTLEVYYSKQLLYQSVATEDGFPEG